MSTGSRIVSRRGMAPLSSPTIIIRLPSMPRCSAIIVTYNSAGSILQCLHALAGQDCEIVVVDNASRDDTVSKVEAFRAEHPLQLLRISRNLGFAAGVNHGARAAAGDVFLILNPDAIAQSGAVATVLECMAGQSAAAAGGALLNASGEPDRGFAFRSLPTLGSLLCEVLLVNQIWPSNPVNRRYRCLDADYSKVQQVEQPAGACLAITREAWETVGGMDTQFAPVWFEDVDLCQRLIDSGRKIVYCPTARFHHSGAHSVSQLTFAQKQLFWYTNMLRYARKHFSALKVWILRVGMLKGMLLRSLAALLGAHPEHVSTREATQAYWDVIKLAIGHPQAQP
jgi:N-acetylglucosaminyl-diphospho-decaprenol L-rhamnosyltransferase